MILIWSIALYFINDALHVILLNTLGAGVRVHHTLKPCISRSFCTTL